MEFEFLYWHWIVIGICLMLAEIFIGSFFIFWFGAAAVLIGVALLVFPTISSIVQVLLWGIFSVAFALAWFKFLKPMSKDRTQAGLSRESLIGQIGQVLETPNDDRKGKMRFPVPVLGNDEWLFISEETLHPGDRVNVVDLSGNSLIVKKH